MTPAEIKVVTDQIDANMTVIAITGGLALVLAFVQWGEAIRLGFRHRTHAIPMPVLLFFFANDLTYILNYSRWFHEINHPFFTMGWYLILPYLALELIVVGQAVHFSHKEIFPSLTKGQACVAVTAMMVAMFVFFQWMNHAMDDYLLQKGCMMTLIASNLNILLLNRRRSRHGQSMLFAVVLLFTAGALQFFLYFPLIDKASFGTPEFYALGGVTTLLGVIYVIALKRTPPALQAS